MKKLIDHDICSSLKNFLQYKTWKDLEAAKMVSGRFYQYNDERLTNKYVYGSPVAPWCFDSAQSGLVTIPTGFGPYTRDHMSIDFQNGRLISDTPLPNLTGVYQFPHSEVSFFVSTRGDWSLLNDSTFLNLPDLEPADSYVPPYSYITPVVFVKSQDTTNKVLCLGGLEWTVWNFRLTVITKDEYELVGIQKVIRDCVRGTFPILEDTPLNPWSDLKYGYWNYLDNCGYTYYGFIEDSSFKIIEPDLFSLDHPNTFMGVGTIEVRVPRTPRIPNSDPEMTSAYALTDIDDNFISDDEDKFVI